MPEINTMRAILVAGAVLAVVVAAVVQQWAPVGILTVGIGAHALMWRHLHREAAARADAPARTAPPRA
jgi:hypothetical protein